MTATNEKIRLALIYGSVREGRFCDRVAGWARAQIAQRPEFSLDVIDPAELDLPLRHERSAASDLPALRQRIARADAFVVVVPEYNHGYPAALKHLIDSLYDEWQAKPAAFISYGGMSGGLRAVEQLRQVFAELHVASIRDGVCFPNVWDQFEADGALRNPASSERALSRMLTQLHWWAAALRTARQNVPYKEVTA